MNKKTILANFFLLAIFTLQAQVCDGNFGDNIFEAGDFGSGMTNVLFTNPNIAPGYIYTTSGPPRDGEYIITNNTGAWSGLYPTWAGIRDNSDDPNGYMMVVNASYAEGDFYEQTITGLCENTLYEFTADIFNLIRIRVPDHIRPNVSFFLDNTLQYTTGNIEESERWQTYGFTFITSPGQNSMKLSLRNNAPGGIGNDLALDNITFRPCGPTALILPQTVANICEDGEPIELEATVNGDQYESLHFQWQQSIDGGLTWENIEGATTNTYLHTELAADDYYYRYLLAGQEDNVENAKCRVNSNIKVVRVVPKCYAIVDTICQGLSYEVGMSSYKVTGNYIDTLRSSLGCDSIVKLDLTIVPDKGIQVDTTIQHPSCYNYSDGSFTIDSIRNSYLPTTIYVDGVQQRTNSYDSLPSGIYQVRIEDTYGCSFERGMILENPNPFELDLGNDQIIDLGERTSVELTTSHLLQSLVCAASESLNIPIGEECLGQSFLPSASGVYRATAVSEAGCMATDSVQIFLREVMRVYFPTAFSPNNDGVNDFFSIYGDEPNVQRIVSLQIYNRWGGLVFETNDIAPNDVKAGWDGYIRNSPAKSDIYAYLAKVEFLSGKVIPFHGGLALWR